MAKLPDVIVKEHKATVKMPAEMWDEVARIAKVQDVTPSHLIRRAVRNYVEALR